jgi:hypothetical protein
MIGVCLALSALMGGLIWYYRMADDFEWGFLFLLSPLVFVLVPDLAIYSTGRKVSNITILPGKGSFGLPGVALFLTYVISISIYISLISIGGRLLYSPDADFVQNLGINIVSWFLLPVHSAALLVYTIACRKYVRSQRVVAVRTALCTAIVRNLEHRYVCSVYNALGLSPSEKTEFEDTNSWRSPHSSFVSQCKHSSFLANGLFEIINN